MRWQKQRSIDLLWLSLELKHQCDRFLDTKERRIAQESGFFGIGADHDKIRKLRAEKSPACEQLKQWGVQRQQQGGFF